MIAILHMVVSIILSINFFKPIHVNTGFETIAYNGMDGITTLSQDTFIRNICKGYSYIVAFILIFSFWKTIEYIAPKLRQNKKFAVSYLTVIFIGLLFLLFSYPYFLIEDATCDFTYNYVYAKEFMPMHWHGFLTNVVMCAIMIFIPHPIALTLIPFFCFTTIILYILVNIADFNKISLPYIFLIFLFIFLLPEAMPAAAMPGRNANYAIVSLAYYAALFLDYVNNTKLTTKKYIVLTLLVSILSTWRVEGLIYIVFYPLILNAVYKQKDSSFLAKNLLLGAMVFVVMFLLLQLPQSYGMKKYYDKDYFIINTPMPLSAVYMSEDANLTYKGAPEDLANIDKVYPVRYLKEWGGAASIRNNMEHGRISRQCGTGFDGTKYVISAYRILAHNPIIFLKKQINNYLIANKFYKYFYLPAPNISNLEEGLPKEELEFSKSTSAYYKVGRNDIESNYPLFGRFGFGRHIKSILSKSYKIFHYLSVHFMKYNKLAITILISLTLLCSLVRKEWIWVAMAGNILSIFTAIFLFAPDPHEEYYYATYLCQYLYLFLYIKEHFEIRRIK